jgi:cell wall-associated NlpC family hydrolase
VIAVLAVAISTTGATAAHAAPSTSELNKQIQKASDDLENITEAYNKANISLNKTIADEKSLAASLGPARAALIVAGKQVNTMAASAYKTGQVGPMTAVLDDSSNLLDKMSYLDVISRGRQRDIDTYTATTANYADRQAALKTTQAKQTAESAALKARKTKIEADVKKLLAMRKAAYGQAQETGSRYTGAIPAISGAAGKAVTFAFNHIGDPYQYAADGPHAFDCSGLTEAAWAAAGKSLPHNAAEQYSATARISRADLKEGDLVFYRSLGHVALYVGNNQIIDAPHTGTNVGKRSINIMTPYGYGRVR